MGSLIEPLLNMTGNVIELAGALDLILGGWFIISSLMAFLLVNTFGFWEVTKDFINSLYNSFLIWTVVSFFMMLITLESGLNLLSFEKWLFFFIPSSFLLVYKVATDK